MRSAWRPATGPSPPGAEALTIDAGSLVLQMKTGGRLLLYGKLPEPSPASSLPTIVPVLAASTKLASHVPSCSHRTRAFNRSSSSSKTPMATRNRFCPFNFPCLASAKRPELNQERRPQGCITASLTAPFLQGLFGLRRISRNARLLHQLCFQVQGYREPLGYVVEADQLHRIF